MSLLKSKQIKEDFVILLSQYFGELNHDTSKPHLSILQIGDNRPSQVYIDLKCAFAKKIGLSTNLISINSDLEIEKLATIRTESELMAVIGDTYGLIIQLPIPAKLRHLVNLIPTTIDVDLINPHSQTKFRDCILPPTINAIDIMLKYALLESNQLLNQENMSNVAIARMGKKLSVQDLLKHNLDLSGKIIAIVGQGVLVGSPLIEYAKARNATIISINKDSTNVNELTRMADIVVCAAGSPGLVDQSWLKPNAIIIDAATSESQTGKLIGDIDYANIDENLVTIVPSPGGIGPLTVASIFYNLYQLISTLPKS